MCAWRGRCRRLGGRVRGAGSGCYFVRLLLALAAPSPLLSRGAVLCNLTSGGFVGALTRVAHHKCQVACAVVSRVRNANLAFKWLGYCSTGEHVSVSLIAHGERLSPLWPARRVCAPDRVGRGGCLSRCATGVCVRAPPLLPAARMSRLSLSLHDLTYQSSRDMSCVCGRGRARGPRTPILYSHPQTRMLSEPRSKTVPSARQVVLI